MLLLRKVLNLWESRERSFMKYWVFLLVSCVGLVGCKSESRRTTSQPAVSVKSRKGTKKGLLKPMLRRVAEASKPAPVRRVKSKPRPRPVTLPQRSCKLSVSKPGWFELAELTADRTSLRRTLRRLRYRMPHKKRTYILVTRVIPGVGQPAYQHYSLENTGFMYSRRKYWPASTVKVWAAVGALLTLREFGLTGQDKLVFSDRLGKFKGTAADLYGKIVNEKYDRLMRIAGLKRFHSAERRQKYGFPKMVISRAYSPLRTLRYSPRIVYYKKGKRGVIPRRRFRKRFPRCRSNCITFLELQEVLRRLVLHDDLPESEQFPITDEDVEGIKKMLLKTPNKIGRAARKMWGRGVKSYNKSGSARGLDQLENVFLVKGKHKYIVTASVPWYRPDASAAPSLIILNRLGLYTLRAMERISKDVVSVQHDTGPAMNIQVSAVNVDDQRFTIDILAKGMDELKVWDGRQPLAVKKLKTGLFSITYTASRTGKRILTVRGFKDDEAIAHKSVKVTLPDDEDELECKKGKE